MLWLLEFLADNKTFDSNAFGKYWFTKMSNYRGYIDHASEETLDNMIKAEDKGAGGTLGSESEELSAAGRWLPCS